MVLITERSVSLFSISSRGGFLLHHSTLSFFVKEGEMFSEPMALEEDMWKYNLLPEFQK